MTTPAGRLTVAECAAVVGIAESTWRSYVARKRTDAPAPVEHVGRTPLWDAAEVEQWARTRSRKAPAGRKPRPWPCPCGRRFATRRAQEKHQQTCPKA